MSEIEEINEEKAEESSTFDFFELLVAILLGLAATGAAWAGYQAGLWTGNQSSAYAEAATTAIKAATEKTDAMINIAQDYQIDILGKQLLREAKTSKNAAVKENLMEMADYLYTWQMSPEAYDSLGLPAAKHATNLKPDEDDTEGLSEKELFELALHNDLDDSGNQYEEQMVADANAMFKKADDFFNAGQEHNTRGDRFDLVGVVYTISLFFAGLALVFKTKVRWGFFGAGVLIFLFSSYFLFTMKWAAIIPG